MTTDESIDDDFLEGRTLQIAQFLTFFQSYYRAENNKSNRPISAEQIRSALHYRSMLEHHHSLENERDALCDGGMQSPADLEQWENAIQESKAQLDAASPEDEEVHFLLRRFEVWSIKSLANHVLMHCTTSRNTSSGSPGDRPTDNRICCSTLLNLPGALHFSRILPKVKFPSRRQSSTFSETASSPPPAKRGPGRPPSKNSPRNSAHPCSLPLPPNAGTFEEYLRLSHMVSLLPTQGARREASTSPLTAVTPKLLNSNSYREDLKLSETSRINQADLVALWIRAQRNTSGLRHLLHLFSVTEIEGAPSEERDQPRYRIRGVAVPPVDTATGRRVSIGKRLIPQDENSPDKQSMDEDEEGQEVSRPKKRHVAKFVGNHKRARGHVLNESHLVDTLVEWAVMNQVLFTFKYIKEALVKQDTASVPSKRPVAQDEPNTAPPQKKRRLDERQRHGNNMDIMHACQCYILRWFARRNRNALAILFSSHPEHGMDSWNETIVKQLLQRGVPARIKEYLRSINSSDRHLARIDRRTLLGKYQLDDEDNCNQSSTATFYSAVKELLDVLSREAPKDILPASEGTKLIDDFELLYQCIDRPYRESGPEAAARELLAEGSSDEEYEDVSNLLLSSPVPWMDRCSICSSGFGGEDSIRVCANCEIAVHDKCATAADTTHELHDFIYAFPPLKEMYCIRILQHLKPPDFRSDRTISWTQLTIDVKRQAQDGHLPSLGIGIRHTEETEESLERCLSGSILDNDLMMCNKDIVPIAITIRGTLVVDVMKNQGADSAGVKESDVITALTTVYPSDDDNSRRNPRPITPLDFASLSPEERVDLLKRGVAHMKLTIQRPSVNLVRWSRKWVRSVRKANAAVMKALEFKSGLEERSIWLCSQCVTSPLDEPKDEEECERIEREATYCRAVIRRLGMECCSLPFHDEEPSSASTENADNSELTSSDRQHPHKRHASLRRLDSMMGLILSRCSRLPGATSNDDSRSDVDPFCVPPWDGSSAKERLEWAPKELESKPFELLCRGMNNLLFATSDTAPTSETADDEYAEQRAALSSNFVSLVSVWCIATSAYGLNVGTRGPPPSALRARAPWTQKSCVVCAARPQSADESSLSTSNVCDSDYCEKLIENQARSRSNDAGMNGTSTQEDNHGDKATPENRQLLLADKAIRWYEHCTSFVGTSLLVLPGDPLLQYVSRSLNFSIDHMDRPMELVVVSYLPSIFVKDTNRNGHSARSGRPVATANEGVFQIIPVLNQTQLKYVLNVCKMRQPPSPNTGRDDHSWTELAVLELEGVICLTYKELQKKLTETDSIRASIDEAVAKYARCSCTAELQDLNGVKALGRAGDNAVSLVMPCRSVSLLSRSPALGEFATDDAQRLSLQCPQQTHVPHATLEPSERIRFPRISACTLNESSDVPSISAAFQGSNSQDVILKQSILIDSLLQSETALVRNLINNVDTPGETGDAHETNDMAEPDEYDDTDVGESDGEDWNGDDFWDDFDFSKERYGRIRTEAHARDTSRSTREHSDSLPNGCQLVFSDLVTAEILKWGKLTCPLAFVHAGSTVHTVVLMSWGRDETAQDCDFQGPSDAPMPYEGVGWGLQLVRWENETGILRVGLVHPNSLASKAGLRMHDILATINGKSVESIGPGEELARAIRGCKDEADVENNGSPVPGPVVLTVLRMAQRISSGGSHTRRQAFKARESNRVVQQQALIPPLQGATAEEVARDPTTMQSEQNRLVETPNPPQQQLWREITPKDVYQPGLEGSFLSRVETAILLEARRRKCPILGHRLLCPRYEFHMVESQFDYISRTDVSSIPNVQDGLWTLILRNDFERSMGETGPIMFHECSFSYRLPTSALPLDRLTECFLKQLERERARLTGMHNRKFIQRPRVEGAVLQRNKSSAVNSLGTSMPVRVENIIIPQQNNPLSCSPTTQEVAAMAVEQGSFVQQEQQDQSAVITQPSHFLSARTAATRATAQGSPPDVHALLATASSYEEPQSNSSYADAAPMTTNETSGQLNQMVSSCAFAAGESTAGKLDKHGDLLSNCIDLQSSDEDEKGIHTNGPPSGSLSPRPLTLSTSPSDGASSTIVGPRGVPSDNECQRIRGGGGNFLSPDQSVTAGEPQSMLTDFPRSSWNNRSVFARCETTKDGADAGQAWLIGFVVLPQLEQTQTDDAVAVSVIFVTNVGFLGQPIVQSIDAGQLYVVIEDSEEARIVDEWRSQNSEQQSTMDTRDGSSERSPPSQDDKRTNRDVSVQEAARYLVERLCLRRSASTPIGILPDGRAVLWMQSDPRALYIRSSNEKHESSAVDACDDAIQRHYRSHIVRDTICRQGMPSVLGLCKRGMQCCVWGCSHQVEYQGVKKNQVLSFRTRSELREHMSRYHSFTSESEEVILDRRGAFARVAEGDMICSLCADLTASICARRLSLLRLSKRNDTLESCGTTSNGEVFYRSPVCRRLNFAPAELLDLTKDGKGAPNINQVLDGSRAAESTIRRMIRLWSRIARLFEVEGNGTFRLNTAECQTRLIPTNLTTRDGLHDGDASTNTGAAADADHGDNAGDEAVVAGTCSGEIWSRNVSVRERLDCSLCSLDMECVLRVEDPSEIVGAGPPPPSKPTLDCFRGIGCALLTEACSSCGGSDIFNGTTFTSGALGVLKKLLIRVASNIPSTLYRKTNMQRMTSKEVTDIEQLVDHQIWEHIDTWRAFVKSSRDFRMVAQAFLLLVCSVNKKKLPTWWTSSRGGWCTAHALISSASFSSLMLQLYVLDAAIAESVATGSSSADVALKSVKHPNHVEKQLNELSTLEDRMALVMKWAEELSFKRFLGVSNEYCARCDEGGSLICCELCANVQHVECCSPPISEPPTFDWVCESCISDVTVLHNQAQSNSAK